MILDIEYNEMLGTSIGVVVKTLPSIPAAKKREKSITIPGMDGTIYTTDGEYESTEIEIPFNFIGDEEKWDERIGMARKWLSARNKKMRLSSDPEHFYRVQKVELDEAEHTTARICNFSATFVTLDGLRYLVEGQQEYSANEVKFNPYEISHPLYKIYGEGQCELNVNGNVIRANVGQNLIIDTERKLAYREDGTLRNTNVTGNYEELFLRERDNEIMITDGFELKIVPNWRCL